MEIYRGSGLPQTVPDWAAPAVHAFSGLKLPHPTLAALDPFLLCLGLAVTETAQAKMRILRVPALLAGASLLALVGLGSWLAGGLA